ncbi:MAG: IPT/TIG domain-containing protein [Acidimicrobiales bacterium]
MPSSTVKRGVRVVAAWLVGLGALLSVVGGTLITTGSVASAAIHAPQDCTFNDTSTILSPAKIGILNTAAGSNVAIACSNLTTSDLGLAVLALELSPLALIANCNGSVCSSSNQTTMDENEADLSVAPYEFCSTSNPCKSTWKPSYTVPSPWKAGGTGVAGFVTAKGDTNASCPPTQQQVNIGLPGCAMSVADANGNIWGLALLNYTSPANPAPEAPQIHLSTSSVSPGGTVSISDNPCTPSSSTVCPYFWGNPTSVTPSVGGTDPSLGNIDFPAVPLDISLCPAKGGSCTSIPNPASAPVVTVTPPVYDFNTSTSTGTMSSYPTISGSLNIPSSLAVGAYNLNVYEGNLLGVFNGNGTNCPSGTTASDGKSCLEATAAITVASTSPSISLITPGSSPLAGGGTAVITGTNLSGASTVDFGSTPATNVKVVSSTEMTATIPAASSPGFVEVKVSTSKGSASSGFVYVNSNIPYVPVTPYRIADTRCGVGSPPSFCASEKLPPANQSLTSPSAGGSIPVQVTGAGSGSNSVPSTAQSVVVTVTAIASPSAHNGYLTVYPTGTNPPTASSLNYIPGAAIPNLVTATLGKGGQVSIYSSSADVNVAVDVEGYYAPSPSTANKFNPLPTPIRALDTRCAEKPLPAMISPTYCSPITSINSSPAPGPKSAIAVAMTGGNSGVPLTATAVSLVATAAGPESGGYLTVWPDAGTCSTPPAVSNVNFHKGTASGNSVSVEVGSTGKLCIYNSAGTSTNVIVDINGYFSSTGDTLTPSSPVRICDTRSVSSIGGGDVASGVTGQCANKGTSLDPTISSSDPMTVQVTGISGIPTTAKAVVANVTVVNTTGNGYLQVWAGGGTQPKTSNINWAKGQTIPNMVVSSLNSSGQIEIYASTGANVIVDVVGWYS